MAMLTLDEDCVSVVLPPSAADNPEMTRPLEKLRFPNSRLSVDEDDETWGGRKMLTRSACGCDGPHPRLLPDWTAADAAPPGAAS